MSIRENYSNFSFYNALPSASSVVPATAGLTVDMQGYGAVTMIVNVGLIRFQSASALHLRLQHGTASAAGVDQWSNVPASLLIHSVAGGYGSTAETGIFQSFLSTEMGSTTYAVGYKGDNLHRYIRIYISGDAGLGSMVAGAVALLGEPSNWPINDAV